MKRQARLFAIAELLRARRTGVTAETLAERFSVSIRTIYRDLDSLRDAALPLLSERGRGGGYALDKSYTLPPVNFTAREAAVLLTAGKMLLQLRMLPFSQSMTSAIEKVRGALDVRMQRELQRQMERLHFVGVPARQPSDDVVKAVERAWFESALLRLTYRRADAPVVESHAKKAARLGKSAAKNVTLEREVWVHIESIVMERTEVLLNCVYADLDEAQMGQGAPEKEGREKRKLQLHMHRILDAEVLTPLR
ncbi:MAG: HTH domain-containing protein [Deltaproteobacteria bacterium]|nr:HTH domain-containing protein [Deltaproteobacteria bacterium]